MSGNTDRPRFRLGDQVSIKDSHVLAEIRGREGAISMPPADVAAQFQAQEYFGHKVRPDGSVERVYWVVLDEVQPLAVGDVDAAMLPESDLQPCS